jgi:hypothetical protein
MTRAARPGVSAPIVEGEKDVRVYRNFIDSQQCVVLCARNRNNAVQALRILKSAGQGGTVAVVDADTDHAAGIKVQDPDILVPDTPDMEGILIKSPALSKLLIEHDKDPGTADNLRCRLRDAARPIGCLRLWSKVNGHSLKFKDLDFSTFVDPLTLAVDFTALSQSILNNSVS